MINKEIEANLVAVLDSYSQALAERDLIYASIFLIDEHIKKLEDVLSRLQQVTAVLEGVDDKVIDDSRTASVGDELGTQVSPRGDGP